MNAPVSEQVRAEAAKSLLERAAEKTKLVKLFRRNAAMKHGVPIEDEREINITPDDTPKEPTPQSEPAQNIVQIVKTDEYDRTQRERELEAEIEHLRQSQQTGTNESTGQQQQPAGMSDKIKGILQTLAVLGGLGAAGYVGSQMGKEETPPQDTKVVQPYYSPYQYLEDTGEHLP